MRSEWLTSLWLRLKRARKRAQLDRELDEEMAFHLAMREEKLRERGVSRDEAPYAARRAFGNVTGTTERTRMLWSFEWVEQFAQDVLYAARSLRENRALAAVVVLSLGLGIGANTAIFSLIDAVVLRFLPVERPGELVLLERRLKSGDTSDNFTNPLWESVRDSQDVFSGVFAWGMERFDLSQGGAVQYADGVLVSGGYFPALGIRPAAGRLISEADDRRGCTPVAVLSYGFWQSRYGGAQNAVGSTISLDHQAFQVIGVSQAGFSGLEVGQNIDVAAPICSSEAFDGKSTRLDHRSWWWLKIMGRVKRGLSREQSQARLAALTPGILEAAVPLKWGKKEQDRFRSATLATRPASTGTSDLRGRFADALNILLAIAGLVLVIACANIASLLLARANARGREIAIRRALGASRGRLIRQLLTESVLLSTLGAVAGLLIARWGSALLVRNLATEREQVFLDLALDGRVMGFTAAVALLTGILMGLLPSIRATRVPLMAAIKRGPQGGERSSRFRASKWIVGMQVAISLVLLIGGGLLLRTFTNLVTLDMGFERNGVLIATAYLQTAKIETAQRTATYAEIESRLSALPGVQSAARSFTTPLAGRIWNDEVFADSPNAPSGEESLAYFNFVSPNYFQTLGMTLVAGRGIAATDSRTSPLVAIINQTMARKFFPGKSGLGERFRTKSPSSGFSDWIEVVGIVKDSKYGSPREATPATAFCPILQQPDLGPDTEEQFSMRTVVPPSSLLSAVQRSVGEVNKNIPLEFHSLAAQVDDSMVQERLLATLSGLFGVLALVLAMIGVYGVLSYLVSQRQSEIGIRMALGAQRRTILGMVMADVGMVLAGGLAAGLAMALGAVNLLQKMLFGLAPRDSQTILVSVGVLCAMAALAGYLPARRATRVDPLVALRHE